MPLPESSISVVCNAIYDFVRTGVAAAANGISVTMGAPAKVADDSDTPPHRINLFFYRFEPGGFDSVAHPNDPWRIRLYCLISAFGIDEGSIQAGENDLRMLGEIIRIFRERPVLDTVTVGSEQVRLQAVFSPITDEQINQVWSTQGDAIYRPSVIYEMALAPVMPATLRVAPSLVGAIGHQARATQTARHGSFSGVIQDPPVGLTDIDVSNPHWVPALCWIYQNNCAHSLSFDVTSGEFAAFSAQIWLAGDSGDSVNLVWEVWDSTTGWRGIGAPVAATPFNAGIDPDNIPALVAPFPLNVTNPVVIPGGANAAQGILYAIRTVTIPGRPTVELRSNPLLLSLYRP